MTKQSYEKPNMEIVMLEDVIKTSGGSSNGTFFCFPDSSGCDSAIGCNPDNLCSSDSLPCGTYSITCKTDGYHSNGTTTP